MKTSLQPADSRLGGIKLTLGRGAESAPVGTIIGVPAGAFPQCSRRAIC